MRTAKVSTFVPAFVGGFSQMKSSLTIARTFAKASRSEEPENLTLSQAVANELKAESEVEPEEPNPDYEDIKKEVLQKWKVKDDVGFGMHTCFYLVMFLFSV